MSALTGLQNVHRSRCTNNSIMLNNVIHGHGINDKNFRIGLRSPDSDQLPNILNKMQ